MIPGERSFEPGKPHPMPPPEIFIEDVDDAREYVAELIGEGVRPLITVPMEYADQVTKYGMTPVPKEDLLTGKKFSMTAGTFNRAPLLPEDEKRVVFEIDPSQIRIEPRFTGSKAFHGVVAFPDGVPPNALRSLGAHTHATWVAQRKNDKGKPSIH